MKDVLASWYEFWLFERSMEDRGGMYCLGNAEVGYIVVIRHLADRIQRIPYSASE